MLDRLAGNTALKQDLAAALAADRLAHSILLVGERGCGAGFAARCLAADYLYPGGGPHAEAVLRQEDTECITIRGEGASGQIKVERIRAAREEITHSALAEDARGRVMFVYGAQDMNQSSANALLKIIEEPPEGVLFLFTATSAAAVLPTIRSRCAAYTITPVPLAECAALLRRTLPGLSRDAADDLAFLYEGHIGLGLAACRQPQAKEALALLAEHTKDLDPRIGMCLDVGHDLRNGCDPVADLKKYHTRVFDVHIKDVTDASKAGKGIELGRGKIDFPALIRMLREVNYTGMCSLEYEKDMKDPFLGIAESIGYFKAVSDWA